VRRHERPFDRAIGEGHLTGSAITVSADGRQVLLLHHRKLDRWLQPGGHGDPGETTGEEVALREALEESGIEGLTLHPRAPRPLDVDVHDIPARGSEPAHQHLDLRYLVVAPERARLLPELASSTRSAGWPGTRRSRSARSRPAACAPQGARHRGRTSDGAARTLPAIALTRGDSMASRTRPLAAAFGFALIAGATSVAHSPGGGAPPPKRR
jgi:ADP-ribose pyrophosphatase YjhB (NUDIX family)